MPSSRLPTPVPRLGRAGPPARSSSPRPRRPPAHRSSRTSGSGRPSRPARSSRRAALDHSPARCPLRRPARARMCAAARRQCDTGHHQPGRTADRTAHCRPRMCPVPSAADTARPWAWHPASRPRRAMRPARPERSTAPGTVDTRKPPRAPAWQNTDAAGHGVLPCRSCGHAHEAVCGVLHRDRVPPGASARATEHPTGQSAARIAREDDTLGRGRTGASGCIPTRDDCGERKARCRPRYVEYMYHRRRPLCLTIFSRYGHAAHHGFTLTSEDRSTLHFVTSQKTRSGGVVTAELWPRNCGDVP